MLGFFPCPIQRLHWCKGGLLSWVISDLQVMHLSPAGIGGGWGTRSVPGRCGSGCCVAELNHKAVAYAHSRNLLPQAPVALLVQCWPSRIHWESFRASLEPLSLLRSSGSRSQPRSALWSAQETKIVTSVCFCLAPPRLGALQPARLFARGCSVGVCREAAGEPLRSSPVSAPQPRGASGHPCHMQHTQQEAPGPCCPRSCFLPAIPSRSPKPGS